MVKKAAGNRKEIIALLLKRRVDKVKIIDKVVKAVVGNISSRKEVIALLLK